MKEDTEQFPTIYDDGEPSYPYELDFDDEGEAQSIANECAAEMEADYRRDKRLAEILGVDVDIVIALLPDDDIVPDELYQSALAQVKAEGSK